LGQRVVNVEAAPLACLSELSAELAVIHVNQPDAPIARTTHSRAPPLAG
jgi:hypothetical protein